MRFSDKSYAKINLFLQVISKRPDGFHNLNTLFTKIDLFDTITIESADKFSISCTLSEVPTNKNNLVWKVKNIVEDRYGISCCINVHIDKIIPIGGGLGGGSSNAATFLIMINKLYDLSLSYDEQADILRYVGSDTVFFLHDCPMLGTGRGEILDAVPILPKLNLLIVNPGIFISTGQIFSDKNLRLTAYGEIIRMRLPLSLNGLIEVMSNDLETPAFIKFPELVKIKTALEEKGAVKAMMSGSGSTLFGIFKDEEDLNRVYQYFRTMYPDYFVVKTTNI